MRAPGDILPALTSLDPSNRHVDGGTNQIMADNLLGAPIGDLIRDLRRRRGLSQATLAHSLATVSGNDGITRHQLARWERGKRIPSRYWRNWIAEALTVPASELDRAAALARFLRAAPDAAADWPARAS